MTRSAHCVYLVEYAKRIVITSSNRLILESLIPACYKEILRTSSIIRNVKALKVNNIKALLTEYLAGIKLTAAAI